jgi:hypothetical protein
VTGVPNVFLSRVPSSAINSAASWRQVLSSSSRGRTMASNGWTSATLRESNGQLWSPVALPRFDRMILVRGCLDPNTRSASINAAS